VAHRPGRARWGGASITQPLCGAGWYSISAQRGISGRSSPVKEWRRSGNQLTGQSAKGRLTAGGGSSPGEAFVPQTRISAILISRPGHREDPIVYEVCPQEAGGDSRSRQGVRTETAFWRQTRQAWTWTQLQRVWPTLIGQSVCLHFNPANVMRLVEVVQAPGPNPGVTAHRLPCPWAKRLGKR